jgi:hypothetical protein
MKRNPSCNWRIALAEVICPMAMPLISVEGFWKNAETHPLWLQVRWSFIFWQYLMA